MRDTIHEFKIDPEFETNSTPFLDRTNLGLLRAAGSAGSLCMVFSINAVESGPNNFAAFQQLALHSGNVSGASILGSGSTSAAGATQSSGYTGGALAGTPVSSAAMLMLGAIGALFPLL
ncbi:hypothetical protein B0H13DRAFT_2325083 [Mycena leptocephala]|nr:hypothetical protein B0H13DRAFT_2325083 [Mycena leptocephala]